MVKRMPSSGTIHSSMPPSSPEGMRGEHPRPADAAIDCTVDEAFEAHVIGSGQLRELLARQCVAFMEPQRMALPERRRFS